MMEDAPETRLAALKIDLPEPPAPVATYVPCVAVGDLLYVSGQVPLAKGKSVSQGQVPGDVSVETARQAARLCAINGLAVIKGYLGTLDRVVRVVRVEGFVASGPDFQDHPVVINGASELFQEVFGAAGSHSRIAVGASSLPLGVPVEVSMIVQFR